MWVVVFASAYSSPGLGTFQGQIPQTANDLSPASPILRHSRLGLLPLDWRTTLEALFCVFAPKPLLSQGSCNAFQDQSGSRRGWSDQEPRREDKSIDIRHGGRATPCIHAPPTRNHPYQTNKPNYNKHRTIPDYITPATPPSHP